MAIAVIGCTAAMAFAAPADAKAALTVGKVEDGKFDVVISLQNCLDFTAGDLVVGYDTTVLEFVPFKEKPDSMQCETLADAKEFTNAGNTFSGMGNAKEVPGEVKFAFNFVESLDAETWGVEVDMADVKLFRMTFKVLDAANGAELTLKGALKFVDGSEVAVDEKVVAVKAPEATTEPTTAEPTTEPTTAEPTTEPTTAEPTTEPTTNEAPSTPDEETTAKGETDKGPATGDTGVLAIAAGVVALAGAAFVVSKKRK